MQIMTAVLHPSTMHQGECGKGFIQKTWIHSGSCNHQLYLPLAFSSPDLHKGSAFSFSQAPDPLIEHSAAVAHLSASFLHRRVSVKLGKIWKRFQRKPSVLNIEEQSLPLSASYLLPNLVNLTLLCSKLSVSPGHTAAPAPQDLPVFFCRGATWPAARRMANPSNVQDCHCLCHHIVLAAHSSRLLKSL